MATWFDPPGTDTTDDLVALADANEQGQQEGWTVMVWRKVGNRSKSYWFRFFEPGTSIIHIARFIHDHNTQYPQDLAYFVAGKQR